MTVFVDNAFTSARGNVWCHMASDDADLAELHQMAKAIGLRRDWLHDGSIPHYDLTPSKRLMAIKLGAVPIDTTDMVRLMQAYRIKCKVCGRSFADKEMQLCLDHATD